MQLFDKLEKLYDKFYTRRGAEIAAGRQPAAKAFFDVILMETKMLYQSGHQALTRQLSSDTKQKKAD